MTMNEKPALYIYGPDGEEMMATVSVPPAAHIPREGEQLKTTDHSDDGAETVTFADGLRVTNVETEFRLVDNIGRGQNWQQIITVQTELVDDPRGGNN